MKRISLFENKSLDTTQDVNNLKVVFDKIRNYLAGNAKGITKDDILAEEVIKILFCKLCDEQTNISKNQMFIVSKKEKSSELKKRLNVFLKNKVRIKYGDVPLLKNDIVLDSDSLKFVVEELSHYKLSKVDRDAIGDAFETFFGPSLRSSDGQFFTPKNVVQLIIKLIAPKPGELVLDPACGSGGFLVEAIDYNKKNSGHNNLKIFGIDKDRFLTEISQTYLSIMGDGSSHIFCEDSLDYQHNWSAQAKENLQIERFDIIMTNPPFGAKIQIAQDKLKQFDLGYKWERGENSWIKSNELLDTQPPQILFIERCLNFLKDGGRLGIVLPEGIFGNPSDRYIWEYLFKKTEILAIISLTQEAFQPSTHTKTSVLVLEKKSKPRTNYKVFMAIADKVGHDKNGKTLYKFNNTGSYVLDINGQKIIDDDLPLIGNKYVERNKINGEHSHLGFFVDAAILMNSKILIPDYYNPEIDEELKKFESKKFDLIKFGELVNSGYVKITRGNEIGSRVKKQNK